MLDKKAQGSVPPDVDETGDVSLEEEHAAIRRIRARLVDDARNAVLWVDLARRYATLGQLDHAERAMERGLILAPDHRFTLRSAARLNVHLDDPEHALALLQRSPATAGDPWLLAAQIAVATVADQANSAAISRLVKNGRSLITSGRLDPHHTTELASALGTLALYDGDRGEARRMFNHALVSPTDNTVAQVEWASRMLPKFEVDPRHLQTPRSFEARAWGHFEKSRWDETLREANRWLVDEPFSVRPTELGTFVSLVPTENFELAARLAEHGLIANREHPLLLNNLAVALASSGRAEEAMKIYKQIREPDINDPGLNIARVATGGLMSFRLGAPDVGRALYLRAIDMAVGTTLGYTRSLAWAFLAREEGLAGLPTSSETLARARAQFKAFPSVALEPFLARVEFRLTLKAATAGR